MNSSTVRQLRASIWRRLHNRHFWQAGSVLMLANVIVLTLGLVRTPAMTWLLPKEQIGMMGVLAAWIPFVQLLSLSGLDSSSYHFVAKGKPWAFVVNVTYRLRWSLLSVVALLVGAGYWWYTGDVGVAWLFVIAAISYPVTIGLTAAGGMLAAQEKFNKLFWYRLWESITDFAGFIPILLSVWWVSQIATFYAANQVATAVMMLGYTWWIVRGLRRGGEPPLTDVETKEVVGYGKNLTAIGSISVIQSRADALLVSFFFPAAVMADYTIALIVYNQIKSLWGIYIAIRYPKIVRLQPIARFRHSAIELVFVSFLFVGIGVVVAVAGSWLISWLLPASYASSIGYMYWLIAAIVVLIPGAFAEMYFRMLEQEKPQYIMRIIGAVSAVLFPVALLYGLDGSVYSVAMGRFLAASVFSMVGCWLFVRSRLTLEPTVVEINELL